MVDEEIITKLAKRDITALSSPDIPSTSKRIHQSFYARKASQLKKKAASTEIQAIPDKIPERNDKLGEPDPDPVEIDDEDDLPATSGDSDGDIGKRKKKKSNDLFSSDDDEEEDEEEEEN